ncbi:hypothetical protein CATMIT_01985, partial [Catenibacterium mitsuokai DSM 15897]
QRAADAAGAGAARWARQRGRRRVRPDRPLRRQHRPDHRNPSLAAVAVGARGAVRGRGAAPDPALRQDRPAAAAHARRALRPGAGAGPDQRRPRPAPADGQPDRPDPVPGGERADLAPSVRRRRPRPGGAAPPCTGSARSGVDAMNAQRDIANAAFSRTSAALRVAAGARAAQARRANAAA